MELVASQILQDGIDNPALVDEIYLQVMMQCTANDKASPDEGFPAFRAQPAPLGFLHTNTVARGA